MGLVTIVVGFCHVCLLLVLPLLLLLFYSGKYVVVLSMAVREDVAI